MLEQNEAGAATKASFYIGGLFYGTAIDNARNDGVDTYAPGVELIDKGMVRYVANPDGKRALILVSGVRAGEIGLDPRFTTMEQQEEFAARIARITLVGMDSTPDQTSAPSIEALSEHISKNS